ncbi:hypothetical protein [Myroides odoratus]|uniref:Uncharacterized protein n=1 Tax=Myroides odoratus TaxID=256 RepID=A0A378RN11_MYROD|nr:hypothetical protein [Myroides odoratus]STZ28406.1 Uncharacterised protein [Myroides odoratus]
MKKAEIIKMIKDMSERKSLMKSYSNGKITKDQLEQRGVKLVKPF